MPAFTRSPETNELIALMKTVNYGEVLKYSSVKECIGVDIQSRRGIMDTAIKHCWIDGLYFICEYGVGYKRINSDAAALFTYESNKQKSRNAVGRFIKRLEGVDPGELKSQEAQQAFVVSHAIAKLQSAISSKASERKITSYAQANAKTLKSDANSTLLIEKILESGFSG